MITVWNYAATLQDTTLTLYCIGGRYHIPIHFDARTSFNHDIMTLVKTHDPYADGNLIPGDITSDMEG